MDLRIRIPMNNMHDVGIQTHPSETVAQDLNTKVEEGKIVLTKYNDTSGPTNLTSPFPASFCPGMTNDTVQTISLGDSQWCVENSTPRSIAGESQPQSQRDRNRGSKRTEREPGGVGYKQHIITAELGVFDWMKDEDRPPSDFSSVEFISPELKLVERETRSESCSSVSSHTSGRSLNEPLDKYMVIRQRTFHGYPRSRKELSILPLTDPKDNSSTSKPSWLYRSKTDLFIERRRTKIATARKLAYAKTRNWHDLHGITFAGLVENLPKVNLSYSGEVSNHIGEYSGDSKSMEHSTRTAEQRFTKSQRNVSSKFPPILSSLTSSTPQQIIALERNSGGTSPRSNPESFSSSGSGSFVQNNQTKNTKLLQGKLRKQSFAAIPLRLWEPPFDCVVVSSRKVLQPRHLVKAWRPVATRCQPSPLK